MSRPRRSTRPTAWWAAVVAVAVTAVPAHSSAVDLESDAADESIEAPLEFDASGAVLLPGRVIDPGIAWDTPLFTLIEDIMFVTELPSVTAVDVSSASIVWTAEFDLVEYTESGEVALPQEGGAQRPLVVPADGVAYAATRGVVRGVGTTPDARVLEVVAIDTATGVEKWDVSLALPETALGLYEDDEWSSAVVGVSDGRVLVTYDLPRDSKGMTFALDSSSGRELWAAEGFVASVVDSGLVIGASLDPHQHSTSVAAAISVVDGSLVWADQGEYMSVEVVSAGPGMVAMTGRSWSGSADTFAWIETSTGRVIDSVENAAYRCQFDEIATVVCFTPISADQVFAVDAADVRLLWQFPEEGVSRIVPDVSLVWRGAVYARTEHGPVVLDAITGADRSLTVGIVPIAVSSTWGIAADGVGAIAYPAVG